VQSALQTVLIRVNGSTQVLESPLIQQSIKNPAQYIERYEYEGELLRVRFLPNAINGLLLKADLPVWGRDRPLILFWVDSDEGGTLHLVGATDTSSLPSVFDTNAVRRGLPIIFPLVDETDQQQITPQDVLTANNIAITQASVRYGSNAIVLVNIHAGADNMFQTHWTLLSSSDNVTFDFNGADLNQLVGQGVDAVAENFANQFASSMGQAQSTVQIEMDGINNLTQFAAVQHYLEQLNSAQSVSVLTVSQDSVLFQLSITGDVTSLQKLMSLDNRVLAMSSTTPGLLKYQWIA
jgi:hypothetical protein